MIESVLIFSLVMTLLLGLALWISGFRTKRAIFKVIEIFCQHNALRALNAKTRDELDLTPPDLLQRMTHLRDFKPYALKILIQRGFVNMTVDGKLYLQEKKIDSVLRCRGNDQRVILDERS